MKGIWEDSREGLAFMQTYIDQHASFHPIRPSKAFKPIKEKGNMPKYQVTLQNYFCISNARAFDNINGRTNDKKICDNGVYKQPRAVPGRSSRGSTHNGMRNVLKKCQEVDTVTSLILISVPNTIEEDVIQQTMDDKLKRMEQSLIQNNKKYKLTIEQLSNWIKYAVAKDFLLGMPWEGTKKKKQK